MGEKKSFSSFDRASTASVDNNKKKEKKKEKSVKGTSCVKIQVI